VLRTNALIVCLLSASTTLAQPRSFSETLTGPPVVTAKSWSVVDAKTGSSFAGLEADVKRDMASTTKVMTALIVIDMIEKDATILDETVTFSRRAAKTEGSAAKIAEKEKILVRHLLYGLMLPSGNDAAAALAEHFGARTEAAKLAPKETDPYALFIVEMNRRAAELGLTKTTFANPHGLTNPTHKSTTNELAKLALVALKKPLFRTVVGAKQYSGPVTTADGKSRTATWTNTNQLLAMTEYYGMKTGTTSAAGSCLIAGGVKEGDDLIVVLLGSSSNEARYADARNLFRWAWNERAKTVKAVPANAGSAPAAQR